jgi:hypothetical protein
MSISSTTGVRTSPAPMPNPAAVAERRDAAKPGPFAQLAGTLKAPASPPAAPEPIDRRGPQTPVPTAKAAVNTQALADALGIEAHQLLEQLQNGNLSKLLSSGYTQGSTATTGGLLFDQYA